MYIYISYIGYFPEHATPYFSYAHVLPPSSSALSDPALTTGDKKDEGSENKEMNELEAIIRYIQVNKPNNPNSPNSLLRSPSRGCVCGYKIT